MEFDGKVALVTGASRGIGSAIAVKLGEQGATVIGTATSQDGVEKINARLSQLGLKGEGIILNVTNKSSIEEVLEQITNQYGAPNILVNNAGITRDNLFIRMKNDEWDEVIDTNLTAIFSLTKACIRSMLKARWGRVINVGSIVGSIGNPGQANYAAAKAAVVGLMKSIAQEVASRGITANTVAPGFIDTDMTRSLPENHRENLLSKIPAQRLGQAEEVASAVSFLASNQAAYITGQTLHVNGGMYMA